MPDALGAKHNRVRVDVHAELAERVLAEVVALVAREMNFAISNRVDARVDDALQRARRDDVTADAQTGKRLAARQITIALAQPGHHRRAAEHAQNYETR